MRLFIKCRSLLLQKSLDKMLKEYKSSDLRICDLCVSDAKIKHKETFIIGKNIKHPFTKEQLIKAIKEYNEKLHYDQMKTNLNLTLKEIKKLQKERIDNIAKRIK